MLTATLRVARRGALSYVLFDGDAEVGWLRGGIVGFGPFAERAQARRAAEIATEVLAEWYATRWHSAPLTYPHPAPPEDHVTTRADVVVGRLLAPADVDPAGALPHGFELALPRETWLAVMVELAERMYVAMRRARAAVWVERHIDAPSVRR